MKRLFPKIRFPFNSYLSDLRQFYQLLQLNRSDYRLEFEPGSNKRTRLMFIVKILKRLLPRFSQLCFKVVPLNLAVILQVDADGKSVSGESYNQSNACFYLLQQVPLPDLKFACVEFFSAFHNELMSLLYNSLQEIFNSQSGWQRQPLKNATHYFMNGVSNR